MDGKQIQESWTGNLGDEKNGQLQVAPGSINCNEYAFGRGGGEKLQKRRVKRSVLSSSSDLYSSVLQARDLKGTEKKYMRGSLCCKVS